MSVALETFLSLTIDNQKDRWEYIYKLSVSQITHASIMTDFRNTHTFKVRKPELEQRSKTVPRYNVPDMAGIEQGTTTNDCGF